jgi:MoaA/NifB/PqqE/SkfB family radical SAM enzyme
MLCLWPFRHVSIDQRGRMRPCCSWRFEEYEEHYDDNTIVNFNHSTIQDYIDSQFLKTLQTDMANDQFPKGGCSDCINEMKSGRDTLFEAGNKKYAMSQNFRIHDMEIKFGNKCNLGCVMCAPACSTLLENESIQNFDFIESQGFEASRKRIYDGITPWFEREDKMRDLAQFAAKAQLIRFTGGEPTVNGYLRKFLQYLKEYTTNIDLKLTTNGFKIPQSLLDSVAEFKSVWFDFSIDGVGKVNEFVRWPSKWSNINENIQRCASLPNSHVTVKTTLHALNVHNIDEICDWVTKNPHIIGWDVNLVWEPFYLRPAHASAESKQVFYETIKKYNKNDKCWPLHTAKSAMELEETAGNSSTEVNKKLTKYLNMLSSMRNIEWQDFVRI